MLIRMAYSFRFVDGKLHRTEKTRDSSGHDHDGGTGQFTSGGSSGSSSSSDKPTDSSKPAKRGILSRASDAAKKAGSILKSGVKVPAAALKAAKKLGKKAMDGIEKRYGSKVKKAVGIAVLISLPIPAPGFSIILSAPILAFAELHRQLSSGKADDDVKPKLVKGLARQVIRKLFKGTIPSQIDLDELDAIDGEEEEKPESDKDDTKAAVHMILKDYTDKPDFRIKDSLGIAPQKDPARMHMRFLVSTPNVDRDWEIVVPAGRVGDSYAKANGPWFFNHQQFPYAIGSTKERPKDPDCPLDLQVSEEGIIQGIYFNQATKEAEILYRLYDDGDMSATSIGFHGLTQTPLTGEEQIKLGSPYPVRRWDTWEHVETSLVGVGANREAMTLHYQRGTVGKLTLTEHMKAAFAPFVLPSKVWSHGAKFPPTAGQSSAQATVPTDHAGAKAMTVKKEADTGNGTGNGDAKKPTHDALETFAKGIAAVLEAMAPKLAMSELEEIKADLMSACKGAWDSAAELVDMHGSEYKLTMPPLPEGISFEGMGKEDETETEKPKPGTEGTEGDETNKAEDDDEELDDEEEKALSDLVTKLQSQIETQEKLLATA